MQQNDKNHVNLDVFTHRFYFDFKAWPYFVLWQFSCRVKRHAQQEDFQSVLSPRIIRCILLHERLSGRSEKMLLSTTQSQFSSPLSTLSLLFSSSLSLSVDRPRSHDHGNRHRNSRHCFSFPYMKRTLREKNICFKQMLMLGKNVSFYVI